MDFTWLALSVGALAMLVTYLAWSIGKQDAGTPQVNTIADKYIEISDKACVKRKGQTVRTQLLIEGSYPRRFLSP